MKTTSGSLVKRGDTYSCFWRQHGKAFCKVLRNDEGQAITTKAEAETAKDKLMAIVGKENSVAALRSIQHAITDAQGDIAALKALERPALPLDSVWPAFLRSTERRDCGESTLVEYQSKWTAFTKWLKAERPAILALREVDRETAKDYAESLNHGRLAPVTFNLHVQTLKYIFRVLAEEAQLTGNPWETIKLKRNMGNTRREFTVDELKKICQSATGELRLLLALGLYTGLRMGDCATLRWDETDLRRREIRRIPRKIARRCPRAIVIPIHPALAAMLSEVSANERGEFVLPKTADVYLNHSRALLTNMVQAHFRACGIQTSKASTTARATVLAGFHSLRHTFVSLARESNAPLSVVESLVGHHSPALTRHYTHVSQLAASNAVGLLPSVTGYVDTTTPAKRTPGELVTALRGVLEGMKAKNWREQRAAALAMLAAAS